ARSAAPSVAHSSWDDQLRDLSLPLSHPRPDLREAECRSATGHMGARARCRSCDTCRRPPLLVHDRATHLAPQGPDPVWACPGGGPCEAGFMRSRRAEAPRPWWGAAFHRIMLHPSLTSTAGLPRGCISRRRPDTVML